MKSSSSQITVMDIGSAKIALLAGLVDKSGFATVNSEILSSSEGTRASVIINTKLAENAIINAIYSLEKEVGKNIKKIDISVSNAVTKSFFTSGKIKISSGKPISKFDISKLIEKILQDFKQDDYDIIDYFALEYVIDENQIVQDPEGMICSSLQCRMHIIAAKTSALNNILSIFAKHNIEVQNFILSSYAAALSVLSEDEKQIGCLCIDFGARSTSFVVYASSKVVYTGSVDMGSWHITNDIAKTLSIPLELAEKIKIIYGSSFVSDLQQREIVNLEDLSQAPLDTEYSVLSVYDLAQIIAPRVEEIFELLKIEFKKIDIDHLISRKIIMTGGGSFLHGIKNVVGKIFNKQVKIAKPNSINGFIGNNDIHLFASAIGMIKLHSDIDMQQDAQFQNSNKGFLGKILAFLKMPF
jgi:cell division protein FtsA